MRLGVRSSERSSTTCSAWIRAVASVSIWSSTSAGSIIRTERRMFPARLRAAAAGTIRQAVYLLQLADEQRVLLFFQCIDKASIKPCQSDAGDDARVG